jgi:hypothetical protein
MAMVAVKTKYKRFVLETSRGVQNFFRTKAEAIAAAKKAFKGTT